MSIFRDKKVSESVTEHVQILMPGHTNGDNRLFGGKLMEWIDVVAAVVARRHANNNVTTAAVDNLQFRSAAYANSTVVLKGRITYVGNTSMEVRVDTFVEELTGNLHMINRAYLVLVALGENGEKVQVPKLILETEEEQTEWNAGKRRSELRKQRLKEEF